MVAMIRTLHKILCDYCCCRRQKLSGEEDSNGSYTLLPWNHYGEAITPETKSKKNDRRRVMAPKGCFGVCVGPERERFVIKIEHVNHPRFMALLQDSDHEYGDSIHNDGPICLPCDVDVFCQALAEIMISDFDSIFYTE